MTTTLAQQPPGPRGLPGLGVAPFVMRDPYGYPPRLAKKYGDVVNIPLPGAKMIYVNHPDHVEHITNKHADRYAAKPALLKEAVADLPDFSYFSFTLDGEPWRRMRQLLRPIFSPSGLEAASGSIIAEIERQVDSWSRWADTAEVIDLQPHFSVLTMSVFTSSFLSGSTERGHVERLVEEFDATMQAFGGRILMGEAPAWIPRPYSRRGRTATKWITEYIDAAIAARREQSQEPPDALDLLLAAESEGGAPLTHAQIRAELRGLIIAGYETTAAALSWTLAFLTLDSESTDAAYDEVDRVEGQKLDYGHLRELTWLRACFDESQRLQGHPFNGREALVDDEIGGYAIPKGATVSFSAYALHRDPRFWREPDRFLPSRFETDHIDKRVFAPFSMGPHRCLGMHLAYVVGVLTLAAALKRYRFELPEGYAPKHKYTFGNPVKGGVPVRLYRR